MYLIILAWFFQALRLFDVLQHLNGVLGGSTTPNTILGTPTKPQDVYTAIQQVSLSEPISRTVRMIFTKFQWSITQRNTTLALQEAQIRRLESEAERLQPQKRREKTTLDPDHEFATFEEIMAAKAAPEAALAGQISRHLISHRTDTVGVLVLIPLRVAYLLN